MTEIAQFPSSMSQDASTPLRWDKLNGVHVQNLAE